MNTTCESSDLLVFSHQRWDFLYRRPHHLLSRFAKYRRVFYFEEPIYGMTELPRLHIKETSENVLIIIPYLPTNIGKEKIPLAMKDLVDELIYEEELIDFTSWYHAHGPFQFSEHLEPRAIIYDCMGEDDSDLKLKLLERADVVLTSTSSLYEVMKKRHRNVQFTPCSLDTPHFAQARHKLIEPDDQINITRPRIGFYGVINQSFDFDLLIDMASLRPEYQFVVVGPVVDVDTRSLPRRGNVHYLGKKDYHALPLYLAGWDCTMLPLKTTKNHQISLAKVLEFLAAGKRVISTRTNELLCSELSPLVLCAEDAQQFVSLIDEVIKNKSDTKWEESVADFLSKTSWDNTFQFIAELENRVLQENFYQNEGPVIIQPVNLSTIGAR